MVKEEQGDIYNFVNKLFPFAPEEFKRELSLRSQKVHIKANTMIGYPGSECHASPIIVSGSLKVYLLLESGREILLYTIGPRETCMFTNLSILKKLPYPAYALAEVDTVGLLLDAHTVKDFFDKYPQWRNFVLEMIVKNLYGLLTMLNELFSKRVDKRLIKYLYERSFNNRLLKITHEELAKDIGTAREVISRLLKDLERDGIIELGRGEIKIRDVERLREEIEKY